MRFGNLKLTLIWGLVLLVLPVVGAQGQRLQHKDRDILVLTKKKKPIMCTVLVRDAHGVVYSRDGKKAQRVVAKKIRSTLTVDDRLARFFLLFDAIKPKDLKEQWLLAEWANENGLEDMAKLQAYRCLGIDLKFAKAHKFLGHRKRKGGFLWLRQEKPVSQKEFLHPKRGRNDIPWFESPHFRVRTSRDLFGTIGNIYDLERVRLDWKRIYFEKLGVAENQETLGFEFGFIPPRSTTDRPYFDPSQEYWFAYTDFENESAKRPENLFSLLTQQLMNSLYAPLASNKRHPKRSRLGGPNDRNAVWLELGFGWWFGGHYSGEPGYAKRGKAPVVTASEAKGLLRWLKNSARPLTILSGGGKFMPNLIGWHFDTFYSENKRVEYQWLVCRALVSFMMTDGIIPGGATKSNNNSAALSKGLLAYIKGSYRGGNAASSSMLDKKLGRKIETVERPFIQWLRSIVKNG